MPDDVEGLLEGICRDRVISFFLRMKTQNWMIVYTYYGMVMVCWCAEPQAQVQI